MSDEIVAEAATTDGQTVEMDGLVLERWERAGRPSMTVREWLSQPDERGGGFVRVRNSPYFVLRYCAIAEVV